MTLNMIKKVVIYIFEPYLLVMSHYIRKLCVQIQISFAESFGMLVKAYCNLVLSKHWPRDRSGRLSSSSTDENHKNSKWYLKIILFLLYDQININIKIN